MPELKSPGLGWMREAQAQHCLLLFRILLMAAVFPTIAAVHAAESESAIFTILSGGRRIGAERFTITRGPAGLEAIGELQLETAGNPKVSERSSLQTSANLKPLLYERRQEAPQKGTLTVKFEPSGTTLTSQTESGSQEQIFLLPDHDLVVLDTNFFHHYEFLIRLYDLARPGPQSFAVFVPQEALPGTISLAYQGKENLPGGEIPGELDHFQAMTEEVKIEIWATPGGEIQRLLIPQASLEIVRQK
ncbi:MAG: hypothetical protein HY313_02865 [Acidobacteria bacterium]|nr:hypothetical protein [Acidobacteriota bacterium]